MKNNFELTYREESSSKGWKNNNLMYLNLHKWSKGIRRSTNKSQITNIELESNKF